MNIETQPSPDGQYFQHSLTGGTQTEPAAQFTDSVADLERLQAGDSYPMVTATPDSKGGWIIEVSLWSQNENPSFEEIASLNGTLAEVIASSRMQ